MCNFPISTLTSGNKPYHMTVRCAASDWRVVGVSSIQSKMTDWIHVWMISLLELLSMFLLYMVWSRISKTVKKIQNTRTTHFSSFCTTSRHQLEQCWKTKIFHFSTVLFGRSQTSFEPWSGVWGGWWIKKFEQDGPSWL